jgi:hypothetical protein
MLRHVCGNEFIVYVGGAINLIAVMLSSPLNIRKFKGEKLRLYLPVVPQKMGNRF